MALSKSIKSSLIKAVVALFMVQLLAACGVESIESGELATGLTNIPDVPDVPDVPDEPDVPAAGSAYVSWSAPFSREDDSALALSEIEGYRVYYGLASGDYQREIDVSSVGPNGIVTLDDLSVGTTYYMVITTYDTDGRESLFSEEVSITVS